MAPLASIALFPSKLLLYCNCVPNKCYSTNSKLCKYQEGKARRWVQGGSSRLSLNEGLSLPLLVFQHAERASSMPSSKLPSKNGTWSWEWTVKERETREKERRASQDFGHREYPRDKNLLGDNIWPCWFGGDWKPTKRGRSPYQSHWSRLKSH